MKATVLTEAYIQQIIEEETKSILFEEQVKFLMSEGFYEDVTRAAAEGGGGLCGASRAIDATMDYFGTHVRFGYDIVITLFGILFPGIGDVADLIEALRSGCRGQCVDMLVGFLQAFPGFGTVPGGVKLMLKSIRKGGTDLASRKLVHKQLKNIMNEFSKDLKDYKQSIEMMSKNSRSIRDKLQGLIDVDIDEFEEALQEFGLPKVSNFARQILYNTNTEAGWLIDTAFKLQNRFFQSMISILNLLFYLGPAEYKKRGPDGYIMWLMEQPVDKMLCDAMGMAPEVVIGLTKDAEPLDLKSKRLEKFAALKTVTGEKTPLMGFEELAQKWGYGSVAELFLGIKDPYKGFQLDATRINKANVEQFLADPVGSIFGDEVEQLYNDYIYTSKERGFFHADSDIVRTPQQVKQIIEKARQ
jgi:hypothetical protein